MQRGKNDEQERAAAKLARLAVMAFAREATIPLLIVGKNGEKPIPHGSGVLFAARGRHFLITAEHVLKDAPVNLIAFPARGRKEPLQRIGTVEMWLPHERKYDVGILEFKDAAVVKKLRETSKFVAPTNIGNVNLDAGAFLCGFPESFVKFEGKVVKGKPFVVDTNLLTKAPADLDFPLVEGYELFAEYGQVGISEDGSEVKTPKLEGASGGGVWQYVAPAAGLWTAENSVRLVAVQNSYKHGDSAGRGGFFRAMTSAMVHRCLHQFAPNIALDIYNAVFPVSRSRP